MPTLKSDVAKAVTTETVTPRSPVLTIFSDVASSFDTLSESGILSFEITVESLTVLSFFLLSQHKLNQKPYKTLTIH